MGLIRDRNSPSHGDHGPPARDRRTMMCILLTLALIIGGSCDQQTEFNDFSKCHNLGELYPEQDVIPGDQEIIRTCNITSDIITNTSSLCINVHVVHVGGETKNGDCPHGTHLHALGQRAVQVKFPLPPDRSLEGALVQIYCSVKCLSLPELVTVMWKESILCYAPEKPRISKGDAVVLNWQRMKLSVSPWRQTLPGHAQCTYLALRYRIRGYDGVWKNCTHLKENTCMIEEPDFKRDAVYDVIVTAANQIGTRSFETTIDASLIVKPNGPADFRVTNIKSTCAVLSFLNPALRVPVPLLYNLTCISQWRSIKTKVSNSSQRQVTVSLQGLTPYSFFNCSVSAVPSVGGYGSDLAVLSFRTKASVPAQAPQIITFEKESSASSNDVTVYWKVLKEEFWHGKVQYKVVCSKCTANTEAPLSAQQFHASILLLGNNAVRRHTNSAVTSEQKFPDAVVKIKACTSQGCQTSQPFTIQDSVKVTAELVAVAMTRSLVNFTLIEPQSGRAICSDDNTYVLVYCQGHYICEAELKTADFPRKATSMLLRLPHAESYTDYRFGFFVISEIGLRSAVHWSVCTYDENADIEPPVSLELVRVGYESCTVRWWTRPCAESRLHVSGFIVVWCPVDSPGKCHGKPKEKHVAGHLRNTTLQLDWSGAKYEVRVYSVTHGGATSAFPSDPVTVQLLHKGTPVWAWPVLSVCVVLLCLAIFPLIRLCKRCREKIEMVIPPRVDLDKMVYVRDYEVPVGEPLQYTTSLEALNEDNDHIVFHHRPTEGRPLFDQISSDEEDECYEPESTENSHTSAHVPNNVKNPSGYLRMPKLVTLKSSPSTSVDADLDSEPCSDQSPDAGQSVQDSVSSDEDTYACFAIKTPHSQSVQRPALVNILRNPVFFKSITGRIRQSSQSLSELQLYLNKNNAKNSSFDKLRPPQMTLMQMYAKSEDNIVITKTNRSKGRRDISNTKYKINNNATSFIEALEDNCTTSTHKRDSVDTLNTSTESWSRDYPLLDHVTAAMTSAGSEHENSLEPDDDKFPLSVGVVRPKKITRTGEKQRSSYATLNWLTGCARASVVYNLDSKGGSRDTSGPTMGSGSLCGSDDFEDSGDDSDLY